MSEKTIEINVGMKLLEIIPAVLWFVFVMGACIAVPYIVDPGWQMLASMALIAIPAYLSGYLDRLNIELSRRNND